MQDLRNKLIAISKQLESKQFLDAITRLLKLKVKHPKQADVLHLLAIAYKQSGEQRLATEHFQASLKINDRQPHVHNNLANLLLDRQEYLLAEEHYLKAITYKPNYVDAIKNLGLLQYKQKLYTQAIETLEQALKLDNTNSSILNALGNVHQAVGKLDLAKSFYQKAHDVSPNNVKSVLNIASVHLQNNHLTQAMSLYEQQLSSTPHDKQLNLHYANTLIRSEQYTKAESIYWSLIQTDPGFVEAHQNLNELYWQTDEIDKLGSSYQFALEKAPTDASLLESYIVDLIFTGNASRAIEVLATFKQQTSSPSISLLEGKSYAALKQYGLANQSLSLAIQQNPTLESLQLMAQIQIVSSDYSQAKIFLQKAMQMDDKNQLTWALRSLIWRIEKDERYEWLTHYSKFVKAYQIPTPQGYSSLVDYLDELKTTLLALHQMNNAPLRQTLRNGSQTMGGLLHHVDPVIAKLKLAFSSVIDEFLTVLPKDLEHPFLSRNTGRYTFSGSWSVRLQNQGYHVNHVHPEGWLSSSFYAHMPKINTALGPDQGVIKFGESSLNLGERERIEMKISPEPGMLVLFPSYIWHGTIPFLSESQYRLTAPFDIIPS